MYYQYHPVAMNTYNHKKRSVMLLAATLPVLAVALYFLVASTTSGFPFRNASMVVTATPTESMIPGIEKKTFGYSTTGRPIEGYIIGSGEHTLFLFGSIHGNEMGTADLMNMLVNEIKSDINLVSDDKTLVIIPITNPDGYYDRTDKLNAREVNLNINFPTTEWKQFGDNGTYAGDEPFSEAESRVIRDVVSTYKPDAMIAFHSQGGLVSPEEGAESIALGKWYAKKTDYEYFDEWDYAGTATRWFWEMRHLPAITVELNDHLESDWNINKDALLELISSEEDVW